MGAIGKIGCLLSVVGAFIIVLHAPEDKDVTSIDELLFYALQPGKLIFQKKKSCPDDFIYLRFCHVLSHGTLYQFIFDL